MKKYFLVCCFFLWAYSPLFSQSNDILDTVLAEAELTPASAAYLLVSAGGGAEPASREAALASMRDAFDGMGETVSAGEYALLLQRQFGLPRGVVSRLAPSPRYALRDLKFLDIIQGRAHVNTPITGERALRILGRVLSELEVRS